MVLTVASFWPSTFSHCVKPSCKLQYNDNELVPAPAHSLPFTSVASQEMTSCFLKMPNKVKHDIEEMQAHAGHTKIAVNRNHGHGLA